MKKCMYMYPLLSSPLPGPLLQPPNSQDSTAVAGIKTLSVSVSFLPPIYLPPGVREIFKDIGSLLPKSF